MQRLPHDLLADVLSRLQQSPRSLAAARCVCKDWRAVVDARRLLTDILPHSLAGLFVHLAEMSVYPGDETPPKYLLLMPPPSNIAAFDYLDYTKCLTITQHCNGLLLLGHHQEATVLSPATRECATLPPPPPTMRTPGMEYMRSIDDYLVCHDQYLAFDPTVSPHYEVFSIKRLPCIPWPDSYQVVDSDITQREWPPSTFVMLVFSSSTNQWEERSFFRQGEAVRTIGYMLEKGFSDHHPYAVCWRGALYVQQNDIVIRIPLSSSNKYQIIELPEGRRQSCRCLGKSENGVYCTMFDGLDGLRLQVWYLDETCDQIRWIIKCDANLHPLLENLAREQIHSPSDVQCASYDQDGQSDATGTEDVVIQSHIRYFF